MFGLTLEMPVPMAVAVYFTIWWIVLFVTLPFGVRSQYEENSVVAGTEPGAPVAPKLVQKAIWTTILSALVFLGLVLFLNFVK